MILELKTKQPATLNELGNISIDTVFMVIESLMYDGQGYAVSVRYETRNPNYPFPQIKKQFIEHFTTADASQLETVLSVTGANLTDLNNNMVEKVAFYMIGQNQVLGLTANDFEVAI